MAAMTAPAEYRIETTDGADVCLALTGEWSATCLGQVGTRLKTDMAGRHVSSLKLDDLGRFDTAGALALRQAAEVPSDETLWAAKPQAGSIYRTVSSLDDTSLAPPAKSPPFVRGMAKIGHGVQDFGTEALGSFTFGGQLIVSVLSTLKNPKTIRWPSWFTQGEKSGLDAIPIVVITNFFIGAVVAFIGVDLLNQFGAGIYAVQLIGVAVFREFAVVITAVLLAGRSASSFAAEIGSMRMNQEVDAMRVMGVNPFQALVLPRVAALFVMLPLLTFLAMLGGLLGGLLVTWSQLNLGPAFFFQRLLEDGGMAKNMMVGMVKAPVFALVVAAIGCRQGMAVQGDVESLGRRVTSAVVQAIFAIILMDAIFAMIFIELGI